MWCSADKLSFTLQLVGLCYSSVRSASAKITFLPAAVEYLKVLIIDTQHCLHRIFCAACVCSFPGQCAVWWEKRKRNVQLPPLVCPRVAEHGARIRGGLKGIYPNPQAWGIQCTIVQVFHQHITGVLFCAYNLRLNKTRKKKSKQRKCALKDKLERIIFVLFF